MKPGPFTHHAPATVDDVVALLAEHGDDAKPLAGGQSLVPMLALRLARFDHLVDLNGVSALATIDRSAGSLRIGAMVRQATAEVNADVAAGAPLVAKALPKIGHFQIRNRGTVGGSIAHADPASELPAVSLCLDATMHAAGPGGTRTIAAGDFFVSTWQTALADGEVLTAVELPSWGSGSGFAVEEVARRSGDFAIAGAACAVQVAGDDVVKAAIALFGVAPTPVRAPLAEQALLAGGAGCDLAEVGDAAASGLTPSDDVHASGDYRKHVSAVVVRRALARALQEARS